MSVETGLFVPEDPSITHFSTGHYVQRLTVNDAYLEVEDPWVGDFVITDPLMYSFYTTPNAFRAGGLSQLCKSAESSTIPNLSSFDRRWGLLAQHKMVEVLGKQQNLDADHIRAIHIGIEGDDQAHLAFCHQLELAVQRWGGPENYHEKVWPEIAELGGTVDVLKAAVRLTKSIKVKGYELPEWAHSTTREDLDLDRLQYIAAEGLLWFDNDRADPEVRQKIKDALKPDNFEITPDGQLAIKNAEHALVISKLMMLFSTEHWNEPINRAHLHLGIHAVQRTITQRRLSGMDQIDMGETRDPILYYHAADKQFNDALQSNERRDDFMYLVRNTLNNSGMEERSKFISYRQKQYCEFMLDDHAENYPSAYLDGPKRVEFGPRSSTVDTHVVEMSDEEKAHLKDVKVPQLDPHADTLSYRAGPLKNRFINPLVKTARGYERLSAINPRFKKLLAEHQHLQTLGIQVNFSFSPDYAEEFRHGMQQNDADFEGLTQRRGMTHDQRRRILEQAAKVVIANNMASGRLVFKGNAQERFAA